MDKQVELQQWKEIADSDQSLADFSSKNMWPVPYAIICFHCQQAVEKYLKWFLVSHDIEPPKIHDLVEIEKCRLLTRYSVHFRYPQEIRVEKQDMDKALDYAKSVRLFFHTLCCLRRQYFCQQRPLQQPFSCIYSDANAVFPMHPGNHVFYSFLKVSCLKINFPFCFFA